VPIRFACPGCKSAFKVADRKAGWQTSCPKCGRQMVVPVQQPAAAAPTEATPDGVAGNHARCPGCARTIWVRSHERDLTFECARCGTKFVPAGKPAPAREVAPAARARKSSSARTVSATCPGCGRAIPLAPHELALMVECARCDTRFVPSESPLPP
jgi:uncharacterized protein with PIN domain